MGAMEGKTGKHERGLYLGKGESILRERKGGRINKTTDN